jgi:hypothetical protein
MHAYGSSHTLYRDTHIMQRFTQPSIRRNASTTTNKTQATVPAVQALRLRWVAVALSATFAVMGVLVAMTGREALPTDDSMAVQGHAKRYMRINEYLFNGTQKGTAIAQRSEDSQNGTGLVDRHA